MNANTLRNTALIYGTTDPIEVKRAIIGTGETLLRIAIGTYGPDSEMADRHRAMLAEHRAELAALEA